jgi:hypothetical protein
MGKMLVTTDRSERSTDRFETDPLFAVTDPKYAGNGTEYSDQGNDVIGEVIVYDKFYSASPKSRVNITARSGSGNLCSGKFLAESSSNCFYNTATDTSGSLTFAYEFEGNKDVKFETEVINP